MVWVNSFIMANLIGIGSNLDNTSMGIAYGLEKIRFPHLVNLIVNFLGFCTSFLGAYIGDVISQYMNQNTTHVISCIVLCSIGFVSIYTTYFHPLITKSQPLVKFEKPGVKQGIILGIGLSFTNIASSFGATVSNSASLWTTVICITVWGYLMLLLGNVVGIGLLSKYLGKYSALVKPTIEKNLQGV